MGKVKDLTDKKFGRLTVIEQHGFTTPNKYGQRHAIWYCKCDCGNYIERTIGVLKRGRSSCGCIQKENLKRMANKNITHNMTHSKLYGVLGNMIRRCHCEKSDHYKQYGARGITVCDEWRNNKQSFFEWALNNGYKEGLTIERIDNNKGYSPDNCCWIPLKDQYKNKRNNNQYTVGKMPLPSKYEG